MSILYTRNLTKTYDSTTVIDNLHLDIKEGQFLAIMGPSGSGKSTLLHCLSGMDRPTSGSVFLGGEDISALSEKALAALRLTRFGFVFQQAHLMPTLNILDNIILPGYMAALRPRSEIEKYGRELMEHMGIAAIADHDITQVSGGQLQRAGICRALINDPSIIFADEPTGALNSQTAAQILDLLGDIHARGATIVMVTHDAHVAARADRVTVLVDGEVEEDLALGRYSSVKADARLARVTEALRHHSV